MDIFLIALIGLGAIAIGSALGGDGGSGDSSSTDLGDPEGPEPEAIGRLGEGVGGFGPDGDHERFFGNGASNVLEGNDNAEVITAWAGDDEVDGGAGNDRIWGGSGEDTINPGAGDDEVWGNNGNDAISGGFLENVFGDEGDISGFMDGLADRVSTDDGFVLSGDERSSAAGLTLTELQGDLNSDFIRGHGDDDVIADAIGNNTLYGDSGDDLLFALDVADPDGSSPDTIRGGAGSDTIFADDGDVIYGEENADDFVVWNGLNGLGSTAAAVVISDFNPSEDKLIIDDLDGDYPSDVVTLEVRGEDTMVMLGGVDVALLQNVELSAFTSENFELRAPLVL